MKSKKLLSLIMVAAIMGTTGTVGAGLNVVNVKATSSQSGIIESGLSIDGASINSKIVKPGQQVSLAWLTTPTNYMRISKPNSTSEWDCVTTQYTYNGYVCTKTITAPVAPGTYVYTIESNSGNNNNPYPTGNGIGNSSNWITATITVVPSTNIAPVMDSVATLDGKTTVETGSTITIRTKFHDANGDGMHEYVSGPNNSVFGGNNHYYTPTRPNYEYINDDNVTVPTTPGTYTYQVKANDGKVDSNIKSIAITVVSATPVPHDYLSWVDLGGSNGHMFFYFDALKAADYSLDVYRDGMLIQSQDVSSSSVLVNGITRFAQFNPGFTLPTNSDNTLAPDQTARMTFKLSVTVNGVKTLIFTGNEKDLLSPGSIGFGATIGHPHTYIQ